MTEEIFTFRPHHCLCALLFRGRGYSKDFISNFSRITQILNEDEHKPIDIVGGIDSICIACPHKSTCISGKAEQLDKRHSQIMGLKSGNRISWHGIKKLLKEKVTYRSFHHVCAPCFWKKLGLCEKALFAGNEKDLL